MNTLKSLLQPIPPGGGAYNQGKDKGLKVNWVKAVRQAVVVTAIVGALCALFLLGPTHSRGARKGLETADVVATSSRVLEEYLNPSDLCPDSASPGTWAYVNYVLDKIKTDEEAQNSQVGQEDTASEEDQIKALEEETEKLRAKIAEMEVAKEYTCSETTRRVQEEVLAAKRQSLRFFKERFALLQHMKRNRKTP